MDRQKNFGKLSRLGTYRIAIFDFSRSLFLHIAIRLAILVFECYLMSILYASKWKQNSLRIRKFTETLLCIQTLFQA